MRLRFHRIAMLFALSALSLTLLAACSDGDSEAESTPEDTTAATETTEENGAAEASTVASTLSEWDIVVDPATAAAGDVTFEVANDGAIPHELAVVRTDLDEAELPVADGVVDESGLDVVGRVDEFAGGETASGTFTLEAGSYVLICNIPAHYGQGMHAAFTVE